MVGEAIGAQVVCFLTLSYGFKKWGTAPLIGARDVVDDTIFEQRRPCSTAESPVVPVEIELVHVDHTLRPKRDPSERGIRQRNAGVIPRADHEVVSRRGVPSTVSHVVTVVGQRAQLLPVIDSGNRQYRNIDRSV